jgi:threonine/homoserine/homoserine lactone efflux protein
MPPTVTQLVKLVLRYADFMAPALLAGLTGIIQGARHALEPDHVTAVATVMVEAPSPRRGIFYAACWGLGHASMLLFVAGPLVFLRIELPNLLAMLLELAVGVMLVYLGVRTLRGAKNAHAHGHSHPKNASVLTRGRRPFAIGVMHGLAGSGALAALIAIGSPTVATGLACLALYAFGTVIGMVSLATVCGPVLARVGRMPKIATGMMNVAGVASILVGVVWTIRTLAGE